MAIRARVTVEGLKEAQLRLDDVGLRARRPEPTLRSRATERALVRSEQRAFAKGWKRDTPKWATYKRHHRLDPRVLRATGRLEHALTRVDQAGTEFSAYNSTLRWGIKPGRSDLYYAQALAKGVGHAHTKRRMVVIDKPARAQIADIVAHYIASGETRR